MAEPTTLVMIAKAAVAVGSDKRTWTGIASVIAAIAVPFILAIMCIVSIASAGAGHNVAAVKLAFYGGEIPASMPQDYKGYIGQMQESFQKLDQVFEKINEIAEGEVQDAFLVKAVFYSLYYGADRVRLDDEDYQRFADCFVRYEERTRIIRHPDNTQEEETYMVTVAITDKMEIYQKLKEDYGITATYEQQANAVNIWYQAKFGTSPPLEGDGFDDWNSWNGGEEGAVYDLPASEVGEKIVELAKSRLGHPYSQDYRGRGNYVDCSYLTLWCYRQVGIIIPGTAAEQARYCVDNKRTVSKSNLHPGDLVFWSHKPNGRYLNITHVGVYAGGGMVVDASYSKGMVVYRNLFDSDKQVLYGRPK